MLFSKSLSKVSLIVALAAALLLGSCAGARKGAAPTIDELRKAPQRQASAYVADVGAALAEKLPDRIGTIPAPILDSYRKLDGRSDYAAYSPSPPERELFARYVELLPPSFKRAMEAKLLGVYFIENFAGGGMTDFAFGPDKDSLYLVLVLNPKTLRQSLGEWIAYRDASPYKIEGSDIELRSSCPGSGEYRGLLHTLTHEAAHIYDYTNRATPFVEPALGRYPDRTALPSAGDCDFTRGVWESYAKPIAAYDIPRRAETASYGLGPQLPVSVALDQYRALAKTPFFSFYGSGSWAEDFAEAAAWTYLRDKLGIGYEVTLLRGGREELRFSPDPSRWSEARKAAVAAVLKP